MLKTSEAGQTERPRALPVAYIGYLRVSSKEQATNGHSLDVQLDVIRAFAGRTRTSIIAVYEDTCSASKYGSHERKELKQAIQHAVTEKCPLLVADLSRLSRNSEILKSLVREDLTIVSADIGVVEHSVLEAAIVKAEKEAELNSNGQMRAYENKRKRGQTLGNAKNLSKIRRDGTLAGMRRAEEKVQALADFLETNPDAVALSHGELADALNKAGNLNRVGSRESSELPWTRGSIRKPRKRAMGLIAEKAELAENGEIERLKLSSASPNFSVPKTTPPVVSQALSLATPASPISASVVTPVALPGVASPANTGPATGLPMPPLEARPLSEDEIASIDAIMARRKLGQKHVMDELGLKRLNPSIWLSKRTGTKVCPDYLERLLRWIALNECP